MSPGRVSRVLICGAFAIGTVACSNGAGASLVPASTNARRHELQLDRSAPRVEIKEFDDLPKHRKSHTATALTSGPDDAIWVTEAGRSDDSNPVVRIELSGKRSRVYHYVARSSSLSGIATGSDAALWMTNPYGTGCCGSLIRMTTTGTFTTFAANSGPSAIASNVRTSPGNNLWFLQSGGCCHLFAFISRVTPQGLITDYTQGMPWYTLIDGIAMGPDGVPWFTETPLDNRGRSGIARVAADGTITQVSPKNFKQNLMPGSIAAGSDGALWFTEKTDRIGRITTQGVVSSYARGITGQPTAIAAGPDGAMWFTESNSDRIGRITVGGKVTEYSGLTPNSQPSAIIEGPDHNMWFLEPATNRLARLTINKS